MQGVFELPDFGIRDTHVLMNVNDEQPLVELDLPVYAKERLVDVDAPLELDRPQPRHDSPCAPTRPKEMPPPPPAAAPTSAPAPTEVKVDVDHETLKPKTRRAPSGVRDVNVARAPPCAGGSEDCRPPSTAAPPRALSALSHTLRSVTAAAATAYAHAYATGSSGGSHSASGAVTSAAYGNEPTHGEGGENGEERIVGARWDDVVVGHSTRRLLTLAYAAGVQVWDASRLGQVEEVVNLRIPLLGMPSPSRSRSSVDTLRAVDAAVSEKRRDSVETLKQAGRGGGDAEADGHGMHGPVLGAGILPPMSSRRQRGNDLELGILTPHALYVYDLGAGRVSARAAFPLAPAPASAAPKDAREYGYGGREGEGEAQVGTPCGFEVAERAVVVTTHTPPTLVLLARPSLRVLHIFASSALAVPLPVPHTHHPRQQASTSDSMSPSSISPPASGIRSPTLPMRTPTVPTAAPTAVAALPAAPVSALHGRLLAFLAPPPVASPSISALSPSSPSTISPSSGTGAGESWSRTLGRFFSRSAPAAAAGALMVLGAATGATGSPPSQAGLGGGGVSGLVGAALGGGGSGIAGGGGAGAWVRVVDLDPLLGTGAGGRRRRRANGGVERPRDVHVFEAGRAPLGGLAFAGDGTQLFAVRRDGLGAGVWALRPAPSASCSSASLSSSPAHGVSTSPSNDTSALPAPAHLYALRRGRTGAVVEAVAGARDGRFVALATRRRTVHVFAAMRSLPLLAELDMGMKWELVGGAGAGDGGTTEVHALVRIRLPHQQQQPHHEGEPPRAPPAPLAIAFVPTATAGSTTGPALRSPSAPASPSTHGVQDVLVFDPADGVLSLRRITLSAMEAPHSAISVSLPAAVGRLSEGEWLRHRWWSWVGGRRWWRRGVLGGSAGGQKFEGRKVRVVRWGVVKRGKEDWLAQAELSTFTSAPRILPRAIYLLHQFAFYNLGEDYHALIRRYQFAIGGARIDVRRQVEVSAFAFGPNGGDEAFVEGYGSSSSPRTIRRRSRAASSSFDEPLLASALAGDALPRRAPAACAPYAAQRLPRVLADVPQLDARARCRRARGQRRRRSGKATPRDAAPAPEAACTVTARTWARRRRHRSVGAA
ncbi:Glycosyltransferase family 1 protein [Mycena sanguinolenta]|uniref:Glycosyltransferase family 1 protein n=1 Tax=Mycena sanguinolenta TaxID=230812 RepID=A0A8H6YI76_9AGAR|nr:Glycosyltransferase family 1 protein [Mycena sanguinolenta]